MNDKPTTTGELFADEEGGFLAQEKLASDLINQLCGLEQATRFYEINNDLVRQVLAEIADTANRFAELTGEGMSLTLADHSAFVNRRLVRLDFNQYRKAQQLMEQWDGFHLGELCFEDKATMEALTPLASALMAASQDRSMIPYLFVKSLGCVRLTGIQAGDTSGKRREGFDFCLRAYCGLLALVRQMLSDLQENRRPPMIRIKRALQVVADLMRDQEGLFLSLTCHAEVNRELATHLLNTALLSILLGQRLGLNRRELMALGTAALFHDLPKLGLGEAALNRLEQPGPVAEQDRTRVERHWLAVLQRMVESGGFSDELLARLVVIFESQQEYGREDLYPPDSECKGLSLLSSIISVCNRYSGNLWTREGKPERNPHAAMLAVLDAGARVEERPFVLLLLEITGLYPTGSLVLLNTSEIGVVKKQGSLDNCEGPLVKIVVDPEGHAIDGMAMDISRDRSRSIVWPMSTKHTEINPLACFKE